VTFARLCAGFFMSVINTCRVWDFRVIEFFLA